MGKVVVAKNKTNTNVNKVQSMQDVFSYVQTLAKTNKLVSLQTVTGYVALKYANKTVMELHDKKKSIAHVTISNKCKAFEIAQSKDIITRVVPDSYGWRLNTEILLTQNALSVITQLIDSVVNETQTQYANKQQKQQKQKQA